MRFRLIYEWVREYFEFSKIEANGMILLLPLCVLSLFIPHYYQKYISRLPERIEASVNLDSLYQLVETKKKMNTGKPIQTPELSPFIFDPNTIPVEKLWAMGLDSGIARRIHNFRLKGGKFYKKEDLSRIYGLDEKVYKTLLPYINISSNDQKKEARFSFKAGMSKKISQKSDINSADTLLLKKIYGIGSVLSARIIKYRDRLGGFTSMEQLNEVYGLTDSVLVKVRQKFSVDTAYRPVFKNINTLDIKELNSHPYISYPMAKMIVSYRDNHGDYENIEDLKKLHVINDSIYQKLKPYITN